jgi:hypothetical protein
MADVTGVPSSSAPDGEDKHQMEVLNTNVLGMADAREAGAEVIGWVAVRESGGCGGVAVR